MGRIVTNGRGQALTGKTPKTPMNTQSNRYASVHYVTAGGVLSVKRGGEAGRVLVADMATVRDHFGVNQADALRLSLHLTARAIRKNRALPEVR